MSVNPYVFIVGSPRSGTTLLQRIVDAHPDIAITPETHWVPRYYRRRIGLTPSGTVSKKLIRKLATNRKWGQLLVSVQALKRLLKGRTHSYASFVSGIYDLYGKAQGKQLVGDKTPGYVLEIPLLRHLWPQARFVHLIRDARDVYLSARDWHKPGKLLARAPGWHEDRLTTAAIWWEWHVCRGREAATLLGPEHYNELRYESLVAQPAQECAKLCAFLGIPYRESMLRFHENPPRADQPKHPWTPIAAGLRDWRRDMTSEDIERFDALVGETLERFGYARVRCQERAIETTQVTRIRSFFEGLQGQAVHRLPTV